jgi:hydroxypyruvate isomerase
MSLQQTFAQVIVIFLMVMMLMVTGCGIVTPPLELAPSGEIVEKAIALQLQAAHHRLSSNLQTTAPELKISQIKVHKIEPLLLANLPTYHLQGTYQLNLKLNRQKIEQTNNQFDIYLQRQKEGKTWRLITR